MRENVHINGVTLDPVVVFTGTEEEQEKFFDAMDALENSWKSIVEDPSFKGLKFTRNQEFGQTCYLTPSVYVENALQLSYMDKKGPVMHETYSKGDERKIEDDKYLARKIETVAPAKKLFERLANLTPDSGLDVTIERDERQMGHNRINDLKKQHNMSVNKDKGRDVSRDI